MALTIEQKPKYQLVPANNEIMFSVFDGFQTANRVKVKYIAEVYIENTSGGITASISADTPRAKLRVSPNNAGAGIFDLGPIACNYVSPDYLGGVVHNSGANTSKYKSTSFSDTTPHPIHLIDKFSTNRTSCRFMKVRFKVESAPNITGAVTIVSSNSATSEEIVLYNGYINDDETLNLDSNGDYGYALDLSGMDRNFIMNDTTAKFLTNAPTTQYIKETDYMTMPFFSQYDEDFVVGAGGSYPSINLITYLFYNSSSVLIQTTNKSISSSNGGHAGNMGDSNNRMQFAGCGPANINGGGTGIPATWSYYTAQAFANDSGSSSTAVSTLYTFYKQDDDCRYPTIRLTWLNKFGGWDYYNFQKKSINTFTAERTTYTQIKGEWNKSKYEHHGYRGGKKSFVNNITQNITLNTDYITEDEAIWLEELFISTDVYIIKPQQTDYNNEGYINKYVEPITLSTEEHIRKTKVNDKLIQYTFDIIKTKNRKTQRV